MAIICPTVTAYNEKEYQQQMERVASFADRIHLDFMDGVFAPTKSPPLSKVWLPEGKTIDLHIMYKKPSGAVKEILRLHPNLVIVHAEADGDFTALADTLHAEGIKVGIALLAETSANTVNPVLDVLDHVLIFSGHLGYFGGIADTALLAKAQELKRVKPGLEIGWDGGIGANNAHTLATGGIDVLNVGGYIQKAANPAQAYATLVEKIPRQT